VSDLAAVILAAGKGTRMKSRIPKVLHTLAGRPMIQYSIDLARAVGAHPIVVVVGHEADAVREVAQGDDLIFVTQEPQLGTGHAVMFARAALRDHGDEVLILCGDVPLLSEETVRGLVAHHRAEGVPLTVLVGRLEDPTGYGRIVRNPRGRVRRVVEERDATEKERTIRAVNTGTYCIHAPILFRVLQRLGNDNAQGEYYLTDVVRMLARKGVADFPLSSPQEFLGINDRVDLAVAEAVMQDAIRTYWMREGVTLLDPSSVFLDADIRIGKDSVLDPGVILRGRTTIGDGCRIGMGCTIEDSVLEDGVVVRPSSVILGSCIRAGASIGPFAHLRPGCDIGPDARIGNFVEVKNTRIGRGTKASHLSYLGDAEVGEEVNIGAGTITCNYDGKKKHRTIIDDGTFVGSDTQFVAPVKVGKNALVGAGSTITKDVPAGALAVSRARQVNIPGRGLRRTRKG
jgi:bifunctional UDP-N-acetylglucosamine pyrophosphorylase / glucosamine-1-phosphate N-acetyltransferase